MTQSHVEARRGSLLSGSAIYLSSNILNAAIPFALLPVLTRYLAPSEYGQVAMFQMLLLALGAFVGLSAVPAANRRFYDGASHPSEFREFNAACIQILIGSAVVVFAVLWLLRARLSDWLGIPATWVLWAVPMAAFTVLLQLRLGQWQIRSMPIRYGVLQTVQGLLNLTITLVLVVFMKQGADGRIAALLCTGAICATAAVFLLARDGLMGVAGAKTSDFREALQFGVPLIPHLTGIFLLSSVDRLVIKDQLGLAEAGVYMVAVQLSTALSLVFDAVNKAYVPWLFDRLKRDQFVEKRQIVRYTYGWFVLILLGSALAFLIGPPIVALIAGPEYRAAGEVIGWLALGQGFGGMYLMVTNYVFYSKRTGQLSLVTITSGVLNVLLLLALTGTYGMKGAAIAFCLAMGVRFLHTWWLAQQRHPMPWINARVPN